MEAARHVTRSLEAAVAPYVVILALCGFLLVRAFDIPAGADGRLGADVWPKTILVLAMLACAFEIVLKLWSARLPSSQRSQAIGAANGPAGEEFAEGVPWWLPWVGIALTAAYGLLFSEIGYFLATLAFTAAFIYFGNYRRPVAALAVAVVAALAFMFVFMKIVYVALPLGHDPFARLSALIMALMGIK